MIKFDDVTIRRGPRVLFAGADFSIYRGEKAGITPCWKNRTYPGLRPK